MKGPGLRLRVWQLNRQPVELWPCSVLQVFHCRRIDHGALPQALRVQGHKAFLKEVRGPNR